MYRKGNLMDKKTTKTNQMLIEVDEDIHQRIKLKALNRRQTMKQYVLQAVLIRMQEEEKYE